MARPSPVASGPARPDSALPVMTCIIGHPRPVRPDRGTGDMRCKRSWISRRQPQARHGTARRRCCGLLPAVTVSIHGGGLSPGFAGRHEPSPQAGACGGLLAARVARAVRGGRGPIRGRAGRASPGGDAGCPPALADGGVRGGEPRKPESSFTSTARTSWSTSRMRPRWWSGPGTWRGRPGLQVGTRVPLDGDNVVVRVFRTRRPVRIDQYSDASGPIAGYVRSMGIRAAVGAPVLVGGRVWGAIGRRVLPAGAAARANRVPYRGVHPADGQRDRQRRGPRRAA